MNTRTYLVVCEVPGLGRVIQAACSSMAEATRQMNKLAGGKNPYYSIIDYTDWNFDE